MKNQYFGDINDYKKYGLLRAIIKANDFHVLVAWMLTPNDGSADGKFIKYLQQPQEYAHHDPALFDGLNDLLARNRDRNVGLIEDTDLIPGAKYFSEITPDSGPMRTSWFSSLTRVIADVDLVFLDPDNGLEVKSKLYGRKRSSKFLYWREVEELWSLGKSLLIYQHFIREKRPVFVQRMLEAVRLATPGSLVEAFSTVNVVFLMALQPQHHNRHDAIVDSVQDRWKGRINHREGP